MRHCILPFLCICLAFLAAPAGAQDSNGTTPRVLKQEALPLVMVKAVDDFIRPGYRDLMEGTESLSEATHALCEAPSEATLGDAQLIFDSVVQQWSTIEIVRVGPVIQGNRFERFLFFPDRKSTGLKQVQRILAQKDETVASAESLKGKSVAAQGLGALEYVLYGTGWEELPVETNGFRCRYGAAIADNLKAIAAELNAEWEKPNGIQAAWKSSGPENPVFRTPKEAASELLGILVHAAETINDQRLRPFYAGTVAGKTDPGRPKLAIYWRSGNTMPSLSANYRAMQALFTVSDMQSLLPDDSRSVAGSALFVLKSLIKVADEIDLPINEAIIDDEQRAKLDFLLVNTSDLIARLNADFGGAIGLGAGFSFADGD